MIEYDFKNAKECSKKIKELSVLGHRWEALHKFNFAFELIDLLKNHPEVKEWKIAFIKTEYNDEGLGEGVYTDVKEERVNFCKADSWDLDYDEEYYEKMESNKAIMSMNTFLSTKFFDNSRRFLDVIEVLSGKTLDNNEKGYNQLLTICVGKEAVKEWETSVDRKTIQKEVAKPKKDSEKAKL